MVRVYKHKAKTKLWSKEVMAQAVDAVLSGRMGYASASRTFSLPKTTLERKVKKERLALLTKCTEEPPPVVDKLPALPVNKLADLSVNQLADSSVDQLAESELEPEVSIKYEPDDGTEWIINNQTPTLSVARCDSAAAMGTFHNKDPQLQNRVPTVERNCRPEVDVAMPCSQYERASNSSSFVSPPFMDGIEHLFLGLAKTIKSFSARRQVLTKMHVSQYIMEQELKQREEERIGNV